METLIKETHARGMRLMMDLVINHTSDQHAWFQESRSSLDSPKRDWYLWRPGKTDATTGERLPPNNWRCTFGGGSAWEYDDATGEYYLHIWAREQPDLNWDKAEVRQAVYASAMRFWLDRGVDGFRIDTVNMYSKPADFPDAPIAAPDARFQPAAALYCNGPRMHEYIGEMRDVLDEYGAVTVGELLDTFEPAAVLPYVSAAAHQLHMVFQFDAAELGWGRTTHKYDTTPRNWTLPDLKDALGKIQGLVRGTDAWTAAFLENHDLSRAVSRMADDSPQHRAAGAKMLALLQSCLTGTQYVYQGQEIGLVNAPAGTYPLDNYEDVSSKLYMDMVRQRDGPGGVDTAFAALQHLARDHARIPMAWDGEARYGGFSARAHAKPPWMKPHPLARDINVAAQLHDEDSVLAFWRRALRFRKEHADLLVYGDYRCVDHEDPHVYTFVKEAEDGRSRALVVLNFTAREKQWHAEGWDSVPAFATHKVQGRGVLVPFEGRVYITRAA